MIDRQMPMLTVGRFLRGEGTERHLWFGRSPVPLGSAVDESGSPADEGAAQNRAPSSGAEDGTSAVRVLVADDSSRSRAALQAFLATLPGVEVVGEAADGAAALRECLSLSPDVVLMDVRLPDLRGLKATELIKSECPSVSVVVLSMHSFHEAAAYEAGADRFLVKGCSADEFVRAFIRDLK